MIVRAVLKGDEFQWAERGFTGFEEVERLIKPRKALA
jgi:hypothetical protein